MTNFQRDPATPPEPEDTRSLGTLFSNLTQNMTLLVRQEVALARSEMGAKASQAARHGTSLVIGGLIVYMGVLTLIGGLVFVLVRLFGMPLWAAALLLGAVIVVLGLIPLLAGLRGLRELELTPERTVETLKDDVQAIKETIR